MSTINRLLSRKDKHSSGSHNKKEPKANEGPLNGLFIGDDHTGKKERTQEEKVREAARTLVAYGIQDYKDDDIVYVLNTAYSNGDVAKACELIAILRDSETGVIHPYKPNVKLLGAVNREKVTCYLDALLFAMFARLSSFEVMLLNKFEDAPRKRLVTLLILWVNMLRAGKLITVDITKQIQLQLANCGWESAADLCQQDSSEAFTFITQKLALPLITLKMDIFHTGKEDTVDDHKFVNERLLELAIPDEPSDGHLITLEECLEMFFNNKIEVKRYLGSLERRNTMSSVRSRASMDSTKANASHVEVAEVGSSQPSSPVKLQSQASPLTASPLRPDARRQRAASIIQEQYINEKHGSVEGPTSIDEENGSQPRVRKAVMMPAWQFFSLIPWYTNNIPSNDTQVAAHFSSSRPILGICLKRYSMLPNGTAVKRKTRIDIPLEIGLPHFIQDDKMAEDGPAFGNFKLSLQSVVCHRGLQLDAGHYISLVRCPDPKQQGDDRWIRFDDLSKDRVKYTDVEKFFEKESPYLLFYQVIPIEGDPENTARGETTMSNGEDPPIYTVSNTSQGSPVDSAIAHVSDSTRTSLNSAQDPSADLYKTSLDSHRPSLEVCTPEDGRRGRSSMTSDRRQSVVFSDTSNGTGTKVDIRPPTPAIEIGQAGEASRQPSTPDPGAPYGTNTLTASRRGSKTTKAGSRSRPNSQTGEKRLSTSLSRLASRMSRDKLAPPPPQAGKLTGAAAEEPALTTGGQPVSAAETGKSTERSRLKKEAKDKSKAPHSHGHHQHLSKREKGAKPERECEVM